MHVEFYVYRVSQRLYICVSWFVFLKLEEEKNRRLSGYCGGKERLFSKEKRIKNALGNTLGSPHGLCHRNRLRIFYEERPHMSVGLPSLWEM